MDLLSQSSNPKPASGLPSGLDLFFGTIDQARVHLPGFSIKSNASKGLKDVVIPGSREEIDSIWNLILSPPADLDTSLRRQQIVAELVANHDQAAALHKGFSNAHRLVQLVTFLTQIPQSEYQLERTSDHLPRSRIVAAIQESGLGAAELSDRWSQISPPESFRLPMMNLAIEGETVALAVASLARLQHSFLDTIANASLFQNRDMRAALEEISRVATSVQPTEVADLINLAALTPQRIELFQQSVGQLHLSLVKLGSILSFSEWAVRDSFAQATFDSGRPESYKNAWNLLFEKGINGSRMYYGSDEQVHASLPAAENHWVLCGSHMSGKTFFMRRDLMLRLAGQAFGYIPGEGGNIHHADSFVWLDRQSEASPENSRRGNSRSREVKGLSDFGREIISRKDAYARIGARAIWYSDESWTTTSPQYEYRLIVAEDRNLAQKGARRYRATHNDSALDFWEHQKQAAIFHFPAFMDEDHHQRPMMIYTRKPELGREKGDALDVARDLGLPRQLVGFAEAYLAGRYKIDPLVRELPKVSQYTEEERRLLKIESRSLRSLVPKTEELILTKGNKEGVQIQSSSPVKSRVNRGTDFSRNVEEFKHGQIPLKVISEHLQIVSVKEGHFPRRWSDFPALNYYSGSGPTPATGFGTELLYGGMSTNSREIIERQRLFTSLFDEEISDNLCSRVTKLSTALELQADIEVTRANRMLDTGDVPGTIFTFLERAYSKLPHESRSFSNYEELQTIELMQHLVDFAGQVLPVTPNERQSFDLRMVELNRAIDLCRTISRLQKEFFSAEGSESSDQKNAIREQIYASYQLLMQGVVVEAYERVVTQESCETAAIPVSKIFTGLFEAVHSEFRALGCGKGPAFLELSNESLEKFAERTAPHSRQDDHGNYSNAVFFMRDLLNALIEESNPLGSLMTDLKKLDSVHLHQYANYFETLCSTILNPAVSQRSIVAQSLASRKKAKENRTMPSSLQENVTSLTKELGRLHELFTVARMLANSYGFTPVEFNNSGLIEIIQGWNVTSPSYKQTQNDHRFLPGQTIDFSTGVNMSGKTFDGVGLTWSLILAQTFGFAPGDLATLPIFNRIIHIERIPDDKQRHLSSFGTEVSLWTQAGAAIAGEGRTYLFADEPWSSANSSYRDALNFSVAALAVRYGATAKIATHSVPPVEAFLGHNPSAGKASHFETAEGDDGKLIFTHIKSDGIADSQALRVAESLNFSPEILKIARELPAPHEIRFVSEAECRSQFTCLYI